MTEISTAVERIASLFREYPRLATKRELDNHAAIWSAWELDQTKLLPVIEQLNTYSDEQILGLVVSPAIELKNELLATVGSIIDDTDA